ncbi:Asp-tRNA(Asn)/Glu-tRNA(Gln) amidotransferase subunit GatC [Pseudomonas aeruginosa]|nr:Asp-tRNA(Asn)/Glu-tRNA(Gln) amidotransferase subunit GatC [Pseudomonas aeruginosa]
MALERSDGKIAHLARLGLSEADLPRTTETLNNILGLIDQVQVVDTSGVEPLAHRWKPPSACVRTRSPRPITATPTRPSPPPEEGLYLVPKVIE